MIIYRYRTPPISLSRYTPIFKPKIYSFFILIIIASQSYASNIIVGNLGSKIEGEVISTFNYPWSFSFLDNDNLLVATKPGKLWLLDSAGAKTAVKNMVRATLER